MGAPQWIASDTGLRGSAVLVVPASGWGSGYPMALADLDCSSLRRDHEEQPGIAAKRMKRFLQRRIDHAGRCARLRERRGQLRQALGSGSGSFRFETSGERALAPLVGATGKQAETRARRRRGRPRRTLVPATAA